MQKIYPHLNNSADKDKDKGIKTPPVPVNDPKRADKIREADKKRFEKLNKIGTAMLIGFLLLTGLYYHDMPVIGAVGVKADPANTPPLHQDQGLGGSFLPVHDHDRPTTQQPTEPKPGTDHTSTRRVDFPVADDNQSNVRRGFILSNNLALNNAKSPLSGVLERVIHNWAMPINTELLDVNKLNVEWKNEQDFIEKIKQKSLNRPLTLVTIHLQEFMESSGKDLYNLVPQNKARIKLTMRGVDPQSNRLIFEETIVKEVTQDSWAHYEPVHSPEIESTAVYDYSLAMKQALVETSNEIITLLHKYFP
ncbi:hypothetical protein [Haliscomenobacter sp.]|uniref:hypothetical protein n=1 Tax=Haliscomenobacter sp. TaxID=2717303 RepID=UPI0035941407